jgi:hypothetical protein
LAQEIQDRREATNKTSGHKREETDIQESEVFLPCGPAKRAVDVVGRTRDEDYVGTEKVKVMDYVETLGRCIGLDLLWHNFIQWEMDYYLTVD